MKKEPAVNKTVLPNGVKIISKTMPYVRSVSMGVWVNAGARDEAASESGLSHFIEHMIFKGTARRTIITSPAFSCTCRGPFRNW